MNFFTFTFAKLLRTVLLAALLMVGAVWLSGCGGGGGGSGSFTDERDGKKYKTVKIGTQRWMAENLNIQTENSWCYYNKESNCEKYGRLYDWNAAMTACPKGWHLPSREAWDTLIVKAGGGSSKEASNKLKSVSGWERDGNGTNELGFSAVPGGGRYINYYGRGEFDQVDYVGSWWTATEKSSDIAYRRYMNYTEVSGGESEKGAGYSVRCLRD